MTATASPQSIGRLFVAYNRHTSPISPLITPLRFKMTALTDLITYRLPSKGMAQTFESLKSNLFDLRIDMLYVYQNTNVLKRLLIDLPFTTHDSELGKLVTSCTDIYSLILSGLTIDDAPLPEEKLSYSSLSSLKLIAPSAETTKMMAFIDDSLAMEFGFIAAELSFESDTLSAYQSDIRHFLRLSFERFAARAAVMGLWNPDDEVIETPLLRNIKIVQSTIQAESGLFTFQSNNLKDIQTHFENII